MATRKKITTKKPAAKTAAKSAEKPRQQPFRQEDKNVVDMLTMKDIDELAHQSAQEDVPTPNLTPPKTDFKTLLRRRQVTWGKFISSLKWGIGLTVLVLLALAAAFLM